MWLQRERTREREREKDIYKERDMEMEVTRETLGLLMNRRVIRVTGLIKSDTY